MNFKTVMVVVALICSSLIPVMAAEESGSRAQAQVYGWQLMSEQEREQHRNAMRNMQNEQERELYRQQHHKLMQQRARERGVELPGEPMPYRGVGPGMGSGSGSGGGRGR